MRTPSVVTVQSCSGNTYTVNLAESSCTCPNWKNCRAHFEKSSPYRLCKHLVSAICEHGLVGEFPGIPLPQLAKMAQGVALPDTKPKEGDYLRGYFNCELPEDVHERFKFVFGGGAKVLHNFARFQEVTAEGVALDCCVRGTQLWTAYSRLVWAGIADLANDISSEEFFGLLELKDLKRIGSALGIKFGQRKTAVRLLTEAVPNWREHIDNVDVFRLRPLVVEDFLLRRVARP